jgi:hypothetical protein
MKVNEVTTVDEMAKATGGLEYEDRVSQAVQQVIPKFKKHVKGHIGTAGFSNVGIDLELEVAGKPFNVEIKKDTKAQMGGTSIKIDLVKETMELASPEAADEDLKKLFYAAAKVKMDDLREVVALLRKKSPRELRNKIKDSIPFGAVTKEVWNNAQAAGLLQKLEDKLPLKDVNWVADHYNRKGVYYIQIGGAGLFYLNTNPLNLPIPKFESPIVIEFSLRRGGSSTRKVNGKEYQMLGAGYRVQGRLQAKKIKSPMTLDDPAHVAEVFQTIINGGKEPAAKTTPKAADKKVDNKPVSKPAPVAEPTADTKTIKPKSKVDLKQKAKMALATGGKSKKG